MSKTRIKVEIVRSTPKAHLVAADGREGWVQQRWLAADGTVASGTFEKAVAAVSERKASADRKIAFAAEARDFGEAMHPVRFIRASEKAIGATITLEVARCQSDRLVWLPKSQCEKAGESLALVPGWLIRAKEREAREGFRGASRYESHRLAKDEPVFLVRGLVTKEVSA